MSLWIVAAVVMIGLCVVGGGLLLSRRADQSLFEERLGIAEEKAIQADATTARKTPVGDALNQALARRGVGSDL